MNVVYAESSAVLSWLLGEAKQDAIVRALAGADVVVASALTLIECSRGLARARATRRIKETDELAALRLLDEAAAGWNVLDIADDIAERARADFPDEPVRTLDAIHLASIAVFADAVGALQVLTLDDRVRRNVAAMKLAVVPA
jgi:uncharacterized protein with PIN domain